LEGRDVPVEHIDHLKPLSAGGSETVWNKRPACSGCNLTKHARVFASGTGDERAFRIAREQANLTHLSMVLHNLIHYAKLNKYRGGNMAKHKINIGDRVRGTRCFGKGDVIEGVVVREVNRLGLSLERDDGQV